MDDPKPRILVADDEPDNLALLTARLTAAGFEVITAGDGKEALEKARVNPPDVIISDWVMPQMDGLELCKAVHADPALRYCYFIIMTAYMQIEDKVVGLESGADQYLFKPFNSTELLSLVKAGLTIASNQKKTLALATTDGLSGLLNARAFRSSLEQGLKNAKTPVSLLVIDVNDFKRINDTLGHAEGDRVVKSVADFLRKDLRGDDYVARLGGDEFGIILHNADSGISEMVANRIHMRSEKAPGIIPGFPLPITFSIGRATYDPSSPQRMDAFIKRADESMYVEKNAYREMVRNATDVEPLPRRARILVVEDDPSVRSFLAESLESNQYEVASAGTGEKALT
ncbi:MAG: diguanylate cyclase domain-containing protein, partial [bacterium]